MDRLPQWYRERWIDAEDQEQARPGVLHRVRDIFVPDSGNEAEDILNAEEVERLRPSVQRVDLASYFGGRRTNWKAIAEAVAPLLERPSCVSEDARLAFDVWALHVVQIVLPLDVLRVGLDVYDTPGFLTGDPPVLGRSVQHLARRVRPSVCFMYGNASFDEAARNALEELCSVLSNFRATGIYCLHTHVSVDAILFQNQVPLDEILPDDELKQMVRDARKEKYRQLQMRVVEADSGLAEKMDVRCSRKMSTIVSAGACATPPFGMQSIARWLIHSVSKTCSNSWPRLSDGE